MSPPYTQIPMVTSLEHLRKSCINNVNNQRCRRKALCAKDDVWKAKHAALVRDFVLSWPDLSPKERAVKVKRFAELSVCSKCDSETEEISSVTDQQMQDLMEILFPDGEEDMDEEDDDDGMEMLSGDDEGQQDGGGERGDEQPGNEDQNTRTGVNAATQWHATSPQPAAALPTPPPSTKQPSALRTGQLSEIVGAKSVAPASLPVMITSTKSQVPTTKGAQKRAALQDQATEATNRRRAKSKLLFKALGIAVIIWVLVSNWMLSLVVVYEILYSWFDRC